VDLAHFFSFLICTQLLGFLGRGSARRKTSAYKQNKCTHTSKLPVGFEPTTPVFERAKTVHALDWASLEQFAERLKIAFKAKQELSLEGNFIPWRVRFMFRIWIFHSEKLVRYGIYASMLCVHHVTHVTLADICNAEEKF
jgi:hypothetical protein